MVRLLDDATELRHGDVPVKVVTVRLPGSLGRTRELQKFHGRIRREPELEFVPGTLTSGSNGCVFCVDRARSETIRENIGMEKFGAVAEYQPRPIFSDRETAALSSPEEVTRRRNVSDATFEAFREHFLDREVVEITMLNVMYDFTHLVNDPPGIESDGRCPIATSVIRMERDERTPVRTVQG